MMQKNVKGSQAFALRQNRPHMAAELNSFLVVIGGLEPPTPAL